MASVFPGRACLWVLVADTEGWGMGGRLGPEDLQSPWGTQADLGVVCDSNGDGTVEVEMEVRKETWFSAVIRGRTVSWYLAYAT